MSALFLYTLPIAIDRLQYGSKKHLQYFCSMKRSQIMLTNRVSKIEQKIEIKTKTKAIKCLTISPLCQGTSKLQFIIL